MEKDLLLKEQEFHKINFELEQRTSRILQELEVVRSRSAAVDDSEPSYSNDDFLARRSNGLGYEATNRLLQAKLTILNKEVDTLRQDYKTKTEELRRSASDLARTEEERARLEAALSTARESGATLQARLETTNSSLTRAQAETGSLNKELASLKKELKLQRQQASAAELRLNRALEDSEKLKTAAKQAHLQQKEERDQQRNNLDQLQSTIKGLERQRTEFMSICTKQQHLIDNLRRQKAHLEVTRYVQTVKTEFDNILDWCLKSENQRGNSKVH